MSYLCGVLVTQLNECEAFWVLTALLKTYNFRGLYLSELPLLNLYLYRFSALISLFLPNLSSHFLRQGVQPIYYSSEWFSTLFSYNMDFDLTCRIWDILFLEGEDYLFKIGLAILKISERDLLALEFEEIMIYLKNKTTTLEISLFKVADSFPDLSLSFKGIDKKYEEEKKHLDIVESWVRKETEEIPSDPKPADLYYSAVISRT